jgi:hypothetical protein
VEKDDLPLIYHREEEHRSFGRVSSFLGRGEDSKPIAPAKLGMLLFPNPFTPVSKRKCTFREFWRGMVAFLFFASYCCGMASTTGGCGVNEESCRIPSGGLNDSSSSLSAQNILAKEGWRGGERSRQFPPCFCLQISLCQSTAQRRLIYIRRSRCIDENSLILTYVDTKKEYMHTFCFDRIIHCWMIGMDPPTARRHGQRRAAE